MSEKLDELLIEIEVNSGDAEDKIKALADALRGSSSALSNATKKLQDTASGAKELGKSVTEAKTSIQKADESIESASKSLSKTAKEVKSLGKESQSAKGKLSGLFSDIARIAKYRAIRTIIKGITSAIKEGFNMFATWDKEMNGGLAGVAGNVSKVTEAWTVLKGQIGAAAGALFNSFAPIITFILDGLTKIIDVFQMVIRSLQGEYTYYHLIYKEAEATTGAAKELKRVLFGFDDLNVLPSSTGSGVSSNSGSWAYDRLPINSKFLNGIADISNKIKDFLGLSEEAQDIIGGLVGVVGTLIGAKALGGLLGLLPRLISGFKDKNQVLGEQSAKTATETSKVTQLASAFGLATGAAFGLKELLKNWKINIPATIPSPVPQLQAAYNTASSWLASKVLVFKTSVASALSAVQGAFNTAKNWVSQRVITIKTSVASALSAAQGVYNTAKNWITARVITIKTAVASALSTGQTVFNAVKTWIAARVITIKTAVQSATSMASAVWTAAKAVLSNSITIPVVLGVAGIAMSLVAILTALQSQANTSPVNIPTRLLTNGISTGLANYLNSVQSTLNNNPVSVPLKVGAQIAGVGSMAKLTKDLGALNTYTASSSYGTVNTNTVLTDQQVRNAINGVPDTEYSSKEKGIMAIIAAAFATAGIGGLLGAGAAGAGAALGSGGASSILELLKLIPGFANGGMIPNGVGTLFTAGEHGAEVVTNMGTHTGVMNVDQMQEAVAEGNAPVVEALYQILREIHNKDSNVYLDGAKIGQSVSRYQQNQARRGVAYSG